MHVTVVDIVDWVQAEWQDWLPTNWTVDFQRANLYEFDAQNLSQGEGHALVLPPNLVVHRHSG